MTLTIADDQISKLLLEVRVERNRRIQRAGVFNFARQI